MKIGIISQWFAPEEATLPNSLAEESVRCGDEVTVLTAFPSYPGGVIYDGYSQQLKFSERLSGALVHRVTSFLSHDSSAVNRIRTFISFSCASVRRGRVLAHNDVNYVYATPATVAWAAWWVRVRYGVPYVLHVQDLWPESATNSGMMGKGAAVNVLDFFISLMLKPLYGAATNVVAIAPTMAQTLIKRGVPAAKVSTVLNWDAGPQIGGAAARPARDSSLRFIYAGNLGVMQDVETIVRAAALVQNLPQIEFHIYGSGVSENSVSKLIQELGLSNVTFHGRVSKSEMVDIYRWSDFQLVTLKDRPLFHMTIPSKFQASLANAVPVITTVQGDLAELCLKEGVGISARPEDPESLASAIRTAVFMPDQKRQEMIENCRSLYARELSCERGVASIRAILQNAVAR